MQKRQKSANLWGPPVKMGITMADQIVVLVAPAQSSTSGKSIASSALTAVVKVMDIDVLRDGLHNFSAKLAPIFDNLVVVGPYALEEVKIGVEISAEGGFALVGTAKAGGAATVELVFNRQS